MSRVLTGARLETRLGADLTQLVRGVRAPLARAVRITGLPSGTLARATFRLDFRDGLRLKGRRLDDPAHAERIVILLQQLELPGLPRVLARRGAALLEEWVSGCPLDRVPATPALLERAGAVLGAIHRVRPLSVLRPTPPDPAERLAQIEQGLAELVALDLLPPVEGPRLRDLARAHLPLGQDVGIIHRDFCAENLVVDPAGRPHVVDNGTLTVDACDFDLARTWYRWPMTQAERRAFETGYATGRDPAAYHAHFPFWAVAVLVDAARFRHHARTPGLEVPLRRLRGLLRRTARAPGAEQSP